MSETGTLFAVARVRALEKGLITNDKMMRFLDLSAEDILRQLTEGGYGALPDAVPEDIEALIESELDKTEALLREITPDKDATDLFLLYADVQNLKILLKTRLLGQEKPEKEVHGGVYGVSVLSRMVKEQDYRELPEAFQRELKALEKSFENDIDPQRISVVLDKAYYAHVTGAPACTKYPLIGQYFSERVDFDNLVTLLRLKAMGADASELSDFLLPGGTVKREAFVKAYAATQDGLGRVLVSAGQGAHLKSAISAYQESGRISSVECVRDNRLISLFRTVKNEVESLYPVLGYYLARNQEAKCLRLLVTAKRNGLAADIIEERMRELYG